MRSETQRERDGESHNKRVLFKRGGEKRALFGWLFWLLLASLLCASLSIKYERVPQIPLDFGKTTDCAFPLWSLCAVATLSFWPSRSFFLLLLFFPGFVDFANSLRYLAPTGFGSTRNFIFFLSLFFFVYFKLPMYVFGFHHPIRFLVLGFISLT